jgi:hypothetical protein
MCHMQETIGMIANHRLTRPLLGIVVIALLAVTAAQHLKAARHVDNVTMLRVPYGGIQPQVAVDEKGILHLIYFGGDPSHGDLYYVHSANAGALFSDPMRINHEPGSAIAVGNVRGAHLAVGRNGRIHVAWNGTHPLPPDAANPDGPRLPMLYTRTNDVGTAFEPERNVIQSSFGIDGGGAVAADGSGRVYVLWHAPAPGLKGEENRRVWMARSSDDGMTFDRERPAFEQPTGACGCCGMGALADRKGHLYVMFRSATEMIHRDIYLLTSVDGGDSFQGTNLAPWNVDACVMSTESLSESPAGVLATWEQTGQVYYGVVNPQTHKMTSSIPAPGQATLRKHPVVVGNSNGQILLAWTEGMAWQKGGSLGWQVFDGAGRAQGEAMHASDVPVWSLVAAFVRPDGGFTVLY